MGATVKVCRNKLVDIERRRRLEAEGNANDIKLLKQKLIALQKKVESKIGMK